MIFLLSLGRVASNEKGSFIFYGWFESDFKLNYAKKETKIW